MVLVPTQGKWLMDVESQNIIKEKHVTFQRLPKDKNKGNFQIMIWQGKKQAKKAVRGKIKCILKLHIKEGYIYTYTREREKKSRSLGNIKCIKSENNGVFVRENET